MPFDTVVKRPETVSFRAKREILQKKQVMNTVPSSLVVMITLIGTTYATVGENQGKLPENPVIINLSGQVFRIIFIQYRALCLIIQKFAG